MLLNFILIALVTLNYFLKEDELVKRLIANEFQLMVQCPIRTMMQFFKITIIPNFRVATWLKCTFDLEEKLLGKEKFGSIYSH